MIPDLVGTPRTGRARRATSLTPRRAYGFGSVRSGPAPPDELDNAAADARGYVGDLLSVGRDLGLLAGAHNNRDAG